MPLQIVRNDIIKMKVDAIVNAANSRLTLGGGLRNRFGLVFGLGIGLGYGEHRCLSFPTAASGQGGESQHPCQEQRYVSNAFLHNRVSLLIY